MLAYRERLTNLLREKSRLDMEYEREKNPRPSKQESPKKKHTSGWNLVRQTKNIHLIQSAHQTGSPATYIAQKKSALKIKPCPQPDANQPNEKSQPTHHKRMRLGIKHPHVLPFFPRNLILGVQIRVDQVSVLEHFGEEEGFLEIGETATAGGVDVVDGAVAAADAGVVCDCAEAGVGPLCLVESESALDQGSVITRQEKEGRWMTYVLILAIARRAVSVVERLEHFRAQNVIRAGDVEARALVELFLISRDFALIPTEPFGTDAREGLVVSVFAAGDELEAKVDVFLLFEDEAAEDEVAAVEAG